MTLQATFVHVLASEKSEIVTDVAEVDHIHLEHAKKMQDQM